MMHDNDKDVMPYEKPLDLGLAFDGDGDHLHDDEDCDLHDQDDAESLHDGAGDP